MAARKRRTQASTSDGIPGWAMLVIGLMIGLFVAFLVYLHDIDPADEVAVESGSVEPVEEERRPRFEFYSILPELEVVVPEFGREPDRDAPLTDPLPGVDPPPHDADVDDAVYFLQVGSFRETGQADRLKAELSLLGLDVDVSTVEVNGDRWHRVRVGPFQGASSLREAQQRLRANDIDYLVLRGRS